MKNAANSLFLLLALLAGSAEAVTDTFTASGSWIAPPGVTSVTVEVWGGGGAGGGNPTNTDGGGGGGGGGYSKTVGIAVTPGTSYAVNVGLGGVGAVGASGVDGLDSWFSTPATILAKGGTGGQRPVGGAGGVRGLGGAAAAGIGTTRFSGGDGGTGRNSNTGRGGPGGSSAGTAANGTSGALVWTTATAAAPPAGGGIGGNGGNANRQNGFAPASGYGGGGGGGAEQNTAGGNGADGVVVITYTAPPSVVSIDCVGGCTTNAGSVSWLVTFSASVTGGSSSNFTLVNSGLGGTPAITSVTGSGSTRTVTASTGTGSGTLGLDMVNTTGISPALAGLPFAGQVYSIDRTAPVVSSIVRVDPTPTALASVSWTVTFSKNVTGVDVTDFALAQAGGVSGALITGVTPVSGSVYTVTASTGSGNGTLGLNLVDDDTIIDAAGNPLGGAGAGNGNFSGEIYSIVRPLSVTASPILCVSDPSNGGTYAWGGLTNVGALDGVYASADGISASVTEYLKCTGYGFNIPAGAIITGITVGVWVNSTFTFTDNAMSLVKAGVVQATNLATNANTFPNGGGSMAPAPTELVYGSSTNLWGNTWTAADINSANFGAAFAAQRGNFGTLQTAYVDYMPITIDYTMPATALAEYRMDEAYWNGTASEVADNTGNGNNAQAFNGASTDGASPAIAGSPGTCRYGVFDNGSTITQGYVQTPLPDFTTDFTVTAWIRTTNNALAGQRILIDDQNNSGGYGISLGDPGAGRIRFYSRGISPVSLDSAYTIANNAWYFIAAVADITNRMRTIYVFDSAGNLLNSTTEGAWTGGAWGTDPGPVSIGGEVNGPPQSEPPASFHFRGNLDEVRVYQQALDQAAVTAIATQTHACAIVSSVNHFAIDIGGVTASTCTPKNIIITALDSSNAVVTNYTGTINITTSTAHGDWTAVTAAGTLTPGAADSGTATYQFAAADGGVATLALNNDHADTALTVNVVDSLVPASSTTSAAIGFSDNAFVLTNDTVQVAGRPQAMSVAMWRKAPGGGGVCSISTRYTGARNLKAWYTRDIDDPGGTAPSIVGMTSPPLTTAVPGGNNLTLTFSAGTANFNLSTVDVGKYVINLRDDSGTFGGAIINGSSNTITTRPFALVVSAIKQGATNNPANAGPGGAAFAKAGSNFQATVGAYLWNSAADTNVALGDGVPDAGASLAQITANGAAPSYTWQTTVSGGPPYTPVGGTSIPWSNIQIGSCPTAAPNCFSSGIATPTNLSYSEVGSFTLGVAATGFLNTPGVDLTAANGTALVFDNALARNGVVGRFIPDHFDTYVLSLSGLPMACPTGLVCPTAYNGLVYSGQPFSAQIIARNAAGATTQNYDGTLGFSKAVTLSAWNAAGGGTQNPGGGTFSSAGAASTAFSLGATSAAAPAITQNYSLPNLSAPTNIHIRAVDTDAVTSLLAIPANSVEGGVSVANGRLRLFNNFGSEKSSLLLSMQTQFWSGKSWVPSSTDSTTTIPATSVALSNYRDGTGVPTASWTTTASGPGTFALGQGTLTLSAPAPAGKTGCVDVAINLGTTTQDSSCLATHPVMTAPASSLAWLRSQNGSCAASTAYAADPSASACFGVYAPETRKIVHVRELF